MLGDTAVAVHPEDERYRHLVGRELLLPLVGRKIPVVADDAVDPEFGSGAVKVTPAHDPLDFEIGRRHRLPTIDVMTPEARISLAAPERFQGLDRYEARQQVVAELEALGLLERVEQHRHAVGHCYRCDTVIEPRLSDQWFVRMEPLARPALASATATARSGSSPSAGATTTTSWLEGIRDWCISRQLWWGHRIPVWYCEAEGCGRDQREPHRPHRLPRLRRAGAPGRGRARHLVLVLAGAVLQPGLARADRGPRRRSTPATPWSRRPTSCSSGWRG